MSNNQLIQKLKSNLSELDKLANEIRKQKLCTESAELTLALRELIQEQVEGQKDESTYTPAHSAR